MKLSELLKLEQVPAVVTGLMIDNAEDINPPQGLKEAGIILSIHDSGEADENVLDTIISYKIANIDVFIEIPFTLTQSEGFKKMTTGYLLTMASNIGVGLSFLPPETDPQLSTPDELWEQYLQFNKDLADVYFTKKNFDQLLLPLTSYLEYLYIEVLLGSEKMKTFKPQNSYIKENYDYIHSQLNVWFKDKLKEKLYEIFEGQENFEYNAKVLFTNNFDVIAEGAAKNREFYLNKIKESEEKEIQKAEAEKVDKTVQ